jgi:hypothetical protein
MRPGHSGSYLIAAKRMTLLPDGCNGRFSGNCTFEGNPINDSTPHPIIPIPKGPKNRSRHHRNLRSPDLRYPARRSLLWARRNRTFRHPILNPVQGQTRCPIPAAPDIRSKRKSS